MAQALMSPPDRLPRPEQVGAKGDGIFRGRSGRQILDELQGRAVGRPRRHVFQRRRKGVEQASRRAEPKPLRHSPRP